MAPHSPSARSDVASLSTCSWLREGTHILKSRLDPRFFDAVLEAVQAKAAIFEHVPNIHVPECATCCGPFVAAMPKAEADFHVCFAPLKKTIFGPGALSPENRSWFSRPVSGRVFTHSRLRFTHKIVRRHGGVSDDKSKVQALNVGKPQHCPGQLQVSQAEPGPMGLSEHG